MTLTPQHAQHAADDALPPSATIPPRGSGIVAAQLDRSGYRPGAAASAVVQATTVEEVEEVIRYANTHLVPVVTRGAGTGLTGASTADRGEVVLDVSAMNEIYTIDPDNRMAIVGPGVITADLDAAAAAHGLRYAPDPASVGISTIGGNIATNAGGMIGAKYGVTRDHVLELHVITGSGDPLRTGRQTHKGVTGYDLTSLLVGSEGTLAVTTRAAVKLRPIVLGKATILSTFTSIQIAADAAQQLVRAGLDTSASELIDDRTLNVIAQTLGEPIVPIGLSVLLVQFEGPSAAADAEHAARILRPSAVDVESTCDAERGSELFAARRLAIPAIQAKGAALIEDIVVPLPRLAEAIAMIREIEFEHGLPIFVVAHAADGNLHPIICVPDIGVDEPLPELAWTVADRVFDAALRLGGSITGEHGVGLLKRTYVPRELGPVSMRLHQAIKDVFDPNHILNPGKAF